jgi:hypothetical protein
MKHKQFFTGLTAMVLSIGLVLVGCDNGSTDGGGGTTEVNSYYVADGAALQLLLAEKKSPVILAANIDVTGSVIIPAGVTLQVPSGKTLTVSAVLGGAGTLTGTGAVNAHTVALQNVPSIVSATTKAVVEASLAAANDAPETEVALLNLSASALTDGALDSGKTLYVLGTLTLDGAPALTSDGKVVALGTVAVSGTVNAAAYLAITDTADKINTAGATLKTTGAATLTLPSDNSAVFAAIDVSGGNLEITGGVSFSSLTVGNTKTLDLDTFKVTGPVTSAGTLHLTSTGKLSPAGDPPIAVVTIGQGGSVEGTPSANGVSIGTITGGSGGGTMSLNSLTWTTGGNLTFDGTKIIQGQTVNVPAGATVTAKSFEPVGELNVAGAIIVPDDGTLTITGTATGNITGTITAKPGSTITYTPSVAFEFGHASGSLVLEADSTATISGITVKNDDAATGFKLTSGTITWKKDAIEFAGAVTQKVATLPTTDKVTVKSGTYTIPANVKLQLQSRDLIVEGGTIAGAAADSKIQFDTAATYVKNGTGGNVTNFPAGSNTTKRNYKWDTATGAWVVDGV